jgi:DNA-binding XRE family transcriptional regulator
MNQPNDNFEMTQQEIADTLGMNRTTVNYVEKAALEKLKVALEKRGFKVSDLLEAK